MSLGKNLRGMWVGFFFFFNGFVVVVENPEADSILLIKLCKMSTFKCPESPAGIETRL